MSSASPHLPFERLADIAEGRLSETERALSLVHLSGCPRCSADMAWLERVTGLMRTDAIDNEDAPAHVFARAARLLRPLRETEAAPQRGARRRIAAALRFDSAAQPFALGLRGGAGAARQLLFNAESYDLDLRAAPENGAWAVSGQVLGPGEGGLVRLDGAAGSVDADLGEPREFSLPPVPPGEYTLSFVLDDIEITVDGLELETP